MSHVGEQKRMRNGLIATIIEDNGSRDLTVQFETGEIREHVRYGNFNQGHISLVCQNRMKKETYIGMSKQMNNGHNCTIKKVYGYQSIEVEFDNGVIAISSIDKFQKGKIGFPMEYKRSSHIGEQVRQKNGLMATVTEYINKNNITLEFEDGTIRRNAAYASFKNGIVGLRQSHYKQDIRVGTTYPQKNGLLFTITEYRSATDISGTFETGEVREHIPFYDIEKGDVSLKAIHAWKEEYKFHTFLMNCGLKISIMDIKDYDDIMIRFEETREILRVSKKQIDEKRCLPKGLSQRTRKEYDFAGFQVTGNPEIINGLPFYRAVHLATGEPVFMTPKMMVDAQKSFSTGKEEPVEEEIELD